jgi:hypothetical protein
LASAPVEKSYRKLRHAAIALVLCVKCKMRVPQPIEPETPGELST